MQHLLAPGGTRAVDAHAAALDDVQAAARLAGREEHVTGGVGARHAAGSEMRERGIAEAGEERKLPEQVDRCHRDSVEVGTSRRESL